MAAAVALPEAPDCVDLFAGPGGWSTAVRWLDLTEVGVELDDSAVATRHAAGHPTLQQSVPEVDLSHVTRSWSLHSRTWGLIASPPCQTFSQAGKGSGRKQLDLVVRAIQRLGRGEWPAEEIAATDDPRTALVLEPLRWALALQPTWLAFEQVSTVLPVWEAMAEVLREHGWHVVTGNLQAEQYGVPQTRKRAVLLAHRDREVHLPKPTHSRYHNRTPDRLDDGVLPWVSMAEALGWGHPARPSYSVTSGGARGSHSGAEWGSAKVREVLLEAAESGDPDRWTPRAMPDGSARINNQSGTAYNLAEQVSTPASVIACRDLVTFRGANANRFNGSTKSRNDGIRVTPAEAGLLQTFPADYPWQGNMGKVFQQVGNAVPPVLAAALLAEVALA